jgi:hypothetical protein
MSPLEMRIAIHYHCHTIPFPKGVFKDEIVESVERDMADRGLLKWLVLEQRFKGTDGLCVYVHALSAVPWPVIEWTIPQATDTMTAVEYNHDKLA